MAVFNNWIPEGWEEEIQDKSQPKVNLGPLGANFDPLGATWGFSLGAHLSLLGTLQQLLGQQSETCLVLFGEKCFGSFLCFTVVAVLMFAGAAAVFTCTSLHVAMIDPQGAPTLLSCSIGGS